jgi:peptidyl-prolyl cis-trans isomerase B (cyclophilin B)
MTLDDEVSVASEVNPVNRDRRLSYTQTRSNMSIRMRFPTVPNPGSLFLIALILYLGCSSKSGPPGSAKNAAPSSRPAQNVHFADLPVAALKEYRVTMTTSVGKIEIELLPEQAPETVRQFLHLCQLGFYDHTAWHRVVRGSFIQGGDLSTRRPPLSPAEIEHVNRRLKLETGKQKHEPGTVSMARSETPGSSETSFFICLSRQPTLDGKYTLFGKVVSGMDVVEQISNVSLERDRPRLRWELIKVELQRKPT